MPGRTFPLQFLLALFAGWVNRHQQRVIEYLVEENRVLKAQLGSKRLRLSDDDRRRLARKGKALGRELLDVYANIVTPETILAWHRKLIARKWTFTRRRPGRPYVMKVIEELAVRFARENPTWGYERIQGALANLDHTVARSTIAAILARHGIPPAPRRQSWGTFLRTHWSSLAAADFFTAEVWTLRGLRTFFVLFTVRLATRRVEILGITDAPDDAFMVQVARNAVDPDTAVLANATHLIIDRDTKFTASFRDALRSHGIRCVPTPAQAPDCNAFAERWVRSIKSECLGRMILFGVGSLRCAVDEYVAHYHRERNHQGIGNRLIQPERAKVRRKGELRCRSRLGGLLRFYHRAA